MGPVEIVIIVAAVVIVIAFAAVAIVRKLKGKPSGCGSCPYAASCKSAAGGGCHGSGNTAEQVGKYCCECDEQVQQSGVPEDSNA